MEKVLHLNRISSDNTVTSIGEICAFTYSAKRMGSAPTISATFYSFEQNAVDSNCFVTFRGERYFISKTPTSSKSNTDARYKYDLEFVSERVTLDNIYLYNMSYSDGSASQQTTFKFSGTIRDLAERIQLSIDYSYGEKDYYKIIVDEGIDENRTVWKVIDFQDTNVTAAIQESFNTFNLPYYYTFKVNEDGTCSREFHIGNESESVIEEVFKYGAEDSLLSISRTNANYKVINKITGIGSTENLPYYYPNMSATGEHDINYDEKLESVFIDYNILNKQVNIAKGCSLVYHIGYIKEDVEYYFALKYDKFTELGNYGGRTVVSQKAYSFVNTVQLKRDSGEDFIDDVNLTIEFNNQANKTYKIRYDYAFSKIGADTSNAEILSYEVSSITSRDANITILSDNEALLSFGDWSGTCYVNFKFKIRVSNQTQTWMAANMSFSWMKLSDISKEDFLSVEGEGLDIPISESGIKVGAPFEGGKITISPARNVIPFQKTLMPSIYRKTYGNERFYSAKNEDVIVKGTTNDGTEYEYTYNYGEYDNNGELIERHEFNNPFILGKQVEHILNIEDIKPTIKGATHQVGGNTYALDVFAEFAYDENDNDEIGDDDEYKHPYFYGKLNPLGFNLFEHALEQGEMTISMTSGPCGSCNFVIGVNDKKENTVQVDSNGNLLRDKDGNVRSGRKGLQTETPQDIQNNTTNTHVWIALKKDKDTYGVIHPNATEGIKPISLSDENKDTTGLVKADTFVITNILLPNKYIYNAEERLENEIKKYLMENNDEKFNFSIKFSRIYLEEHKDDVTRFLNENARIIVEYFNVQQQLYVSSYTYKMSADAPLPEITVELKDSLATNQGVLKNIADQVKMSVMNTMSSIDVVAQGARAFLRKDQDDTTVHKVTARELTVNGNSDVDGDSEIGGSLAVGRRATFNDTIESKGDITVGDYTEVLGEIQGAKINQDGSGVFKSIRANSLEVFTMIYNQVRSTAAYTAFDDSYTIEAIENLTDANGLDYMKIKFEEDKKSVSHHLEDGDILFGYVNQLNNFGYSRDGRCWLNVVQAAIEDDPWSIHAVMFNASECPEQENIPPTTNMVVMHKGNNAYTQDDNGVLDYYNKERQRSFYISSTDGCIVQLLDVTSPKLYTLMTDGNPKNYSNYGVVIGKLPSDLFKYIHRYYSFVKNEDPIVYAKYLAVQNLLQIDYAGRPIKTERYRGAWSEVTSQSDDPYRSMSATDVTYYDTVTHKGSKWACNSDKTIEEPAENSTHWDLMISKGDDGTSIKIKGEKPSASELPNPPEDPSDCYIVGQDLYVWIPDEQKWHNAGQFKGDKGDKGDTGKDGLSVSMNLMDNTNFTKWTDGGPERWVKGSQDIEFVGSAESGSGANAIAVVGISTDSLGQNVSDLSGGTWYALSFLHKNITGGNAYLRVGISNSERLKYINGDSYSTTGYLSVTATDEWQKCLIVFKASSNGESSISFGATRSSQKTVLFSKVKLEPIADQTNPSIANASDWCLSNYDMEGIKGEDAISFIAAPATLNVEVSSQEQTLISNSTHTFTVYARTANDILSTDDYVIIADGGSSLIFGTPTISDGKYEFTVSIPDNTHRDNIAPFTVYFIDKNNATFGELLVSVVVSQQGIAGPQGKAGSMLLPQGNYDERKLYTLNKFADGSIASKPAVYLPAEKGKGSYLVLEKDMVNTVTINGVTYPADENGQRIETDNREYWSVSTNYELIVAEFLMANFAKFGSENGAVFYDKWLFSQTLQDGKPYTRDIIDKNGNFEQGKYPKYAVNFLNGTSYMTNLIEPMNTSDAYVIRINPNEGFNWFIPCNIDLDLYNRTKFTMSIPCSKPMVILPTLTELTNAGYSDWDINGAHITITFGTGGSEYAGLIGLTGYGYDHDEPTDETYVSNEFILVCVDDAILNAEQASGYDNLYTCKPEAHVLSYANHNFFICGGKRARYVMMAAGTTLKLRPVVINDTNTIHWFVESDGVYSHPINIYSTAYVIPSKGDATDYGNYRVRLHNKTDEVGYAKGWHKNIQTISVYASKETLADESIASNLEDRQEYAKDNAGCVFVCGEPELLPHNIVVSAQKRFSTEGTTTDRCHYRALFTDSDGVGYDMIDFS